MKVINSVIFRNNPDFVLPGSQDFSDGFIFPLVLNNPAANYCKRDTPTQAHHRLDKHIIQQCCEVYGIENPELKCRLFIDDTTRTRVNNLIEECIGQEPFITIEPTSKDNYTKNRAYPFSKWQKIVSALSDRIKFVQLGLAGARILDNAINLSGRTDFIEAVELISRSELFISSEGGLVHGATAVDKTSLVIITGYQDSRMVAYPQNININISNHGPCGLKVECAQCTADAASHDWQSIVLEIERALCL